MKTAVITYAIRAATGRKFCPTQPPLGLGRRWGGLEVVGGAQLGTWATWLGAGGPVGHQGWALPPPPASRLGPWRGWWFGLSARRPSPSTQVQDPAIGRPVLKQGLKRW
jgi:hypothetical protein